MKTINIKTLSRINNLIVNRDFNMEAPIGSLIECPITGELFVKRFKSHAFYSKAAYKKFLSLIAKYKDYRYVKRKNGYFMSSTEMCEDISFLNSFDTIVIDGHFRTIIIN